MVTKIHLRERKGLKGSSYQLDFYLNGKRERPTFETKEQAVSERKRLLGEFEKTRAQEILGVKRTAEAAPAGFIKRIKVVDAIREFWTYKESRTKDPDNLKRERYIFEEFNEQMFNEGIDFVDQVTLKALEAHQGKLSGRGLSASTVNRNFNSIRGFLTKCQEWDYLATSPAAKLKNLVYQETERKLWGKSDVITMLENLPPWARDFFIFLYALGCRPKEAGNLRWEHVDFGNRLVQFSSLKGSAKSGKVSIRKLPMTDELYRLLLSVREIRRREFRAKSDDLVFLNSKGNKVKAEIFAKACRKVRRDLGLSEDLVPYGLRHTLLTLLAEMDVGANKIQAIAGHTKQETTDKYIHLKESSSLKSVIDMAEERRKKTQATV